MDHSNSIQNKEEFEKALIENIRQRVLFEMDLAFAKIFGETDFLIATTLGLDPMAAILSVVRVKLDEYTMEG